MDEVENSLPTGVGEHEVWSGTPSQWQNLWSWVACVLLVPIPWALWRALVTRSTRYALTDQRLKTRRGVFNRVTHDLELYRVKDTHFRQSFWQRMAGIGNIVLSTSDATTPTMVIGDIREAESVRERIRALVEQRRDAKRVRELDLGHDSL
ncbi:PH (Pleckstrin Homology) domain-containing protein [Luteimonas cucumeris]|uniref:PH (Pleckstrin Homology) domain-containing protein n=1 Tax=Luteimonas cucumeris TaxID=985012 RepID=A0A562LEW1_9GAMM|nr:PH domain-containing protein [Luteimonas cucumeris]TWI06148.1 PH (Pleckstrin Homology) domain-containing protein [Luteimonas cucumeris]